MHSPATLLMAFGLTGSIVLAMPAQAPSLGRETNTTLAARLSSDPPYRVEGSQVSCHADDSGNSPVLSQEDADAIYECMKSHRPDFCDASTGDCNVPNAGADNVYGSWPVYSWTRNGIEVFMENEVDTPAIFALSLIYSILTDDAGHKIYACSDDTLENGEQKTEFAYGWTQCDPALGCGHGDTWTYAC